MAIPFHLVKNSSFFAYSCMVAPLQMPGRHASASRDAKETCFPFEMPKRHACPFRDANETHIFPHALRPENIGIAYKK